MDNAVLFHCYCGGNLREALPAAHGAAPVSVSAVAGGGKKYLIPHGTVVQSEAAVAALRDRAAMRRPLRDAIDTTTPVA